MADLNTLYKLMILEMLDAISFSLTNSGISAFFLDKGYTGYFNVQNALSELVESSFVHSEVVRGTAYYTITPEGSSTIALLRSDISWEIRRDIRDYLRENRVDLREDSSVLADYQRGTSGDYLVHCWASENNQNLIDLTLAVPTEDQAKAICDHWKARSQAVYEYLMKELMGLSG